VPAAQQSEPLPDPPPTVPVASLEAGQAEFGVNLYRRLGARPGNIFVSPASISMALAMVHAGAEGETAAEMTRALRYPSARVDEAMAAQLAALPIDSEGRHLSIGNALWVQQGFALRPAWLDRIRRHYGGGARQVDFVAAPVQAIQTINRWAEEKTAGRIKGLLQPENINDRTRLILTNAVYFKADWLLPFQAAQTRSRPFRLGGGGSVSVPMMRQRIMLRLLDMPTFEAVEMPYKGEELSMLIFLPKEGHGLSGFDQGLNGAALTGWIDRLMASERADLELVVPKLELDTKASLVPELQALGMRRAFTQAAQLGGISEADLYLSDVIHQTYLRVDEKGTEAAAVTAGIAEIVSMPRAFHADRPFFFVIRDNRTGTLVFLGRIEQPQLR
jgi:serpin B